MLQIKHIFETLRFVASVIILALTSLFSSVALADNVYQIASSDNSWTPTDMGVSSGGNYEYYESASSPDLWFDIYLKSPYTHLTSASYLDPGWGSTDLTDMGEDEGTYYVDNAPAHYYIIIWYPNTAFNDTSDPKICASTERPDDTGSSCTAPSSVTITPTETNGWRYSLGETIDLTCTASGGSGSYTYQWQKYIGSSWTDINPATNASAATSRLQIPNCTSSDGGEYRCIVSTGSGCELTSDNGDGYFVRVFTFNGNYSGSAFVENAITWTGANTGTVTINLDAARTYNFKITDNDGKWFGNPGTMVKDVTTPWGFGSEDGNATLTTGAYGSGNYVFTIDIQHAGDAPSPYVNVGVTYPTKTTYLELCSDWSAATAKYAVYYWKGGDNGWTDFMTATTCGDAYYVDIPVWATNCVFGRFNPSKGSTGNWDDKWNKTTDQTLNASYNYLYNVSGTGDAYSGTWGTYTPPTYSITFNGNGNSSGSMSNMTGISCGGSATLTANAFTKTSNIFDVWNTAADGSGVPYTDGALITNITSNIALYAQWDDEDCEVMFEGAACGPEATPTFSASIGSVAMYHNNPENSTSNYTYLSSDGYLWLTPKSGTYFTPGDKIKAIVYNQSSGTTYTTGFRIGSNAYTTSIPPRSYRTIEHTLVSADIVDGKVKILRGIPGNGYGCFVQIRAFDCETTEPPGVVTIPGTVNKANYSTSQVIWWAEDNDYFDFQTSNTKYVEWQVDLQSAGKYTVTEYFHSVYTTFWLGHQWYLQLLDGGGNQVSDYTSTAVWLEGGERTDEVLWDLSLVTPGTYTLRVTSPIGGSQPKLKSLTFALAGLSLTYTKTPDEALYGKDGDSYRAYGTINDAVVTTSGITTGASVSASGNVLTIGSVTITAPLTQSGRLDDIPIDDDPGYTAANCTWRFDHWENVPATVTADVSDVIAVYFPTFPVEYELFGGTIHDDPYYTWYRYTGRSEDSTPLPEDVTKEGYMFGGWYQNATTQLFTSLPGHYYGGYTGAWCLKAHWLLPCDEPQTITKVTLTGSSSYETAGYNNKEYVGTPVISVSGTTATYDVDEDGNDETGYELGTAEDLVFVTVKDGFRTGDIIRVAITATNTDGRISSSATYLDLFYGTGAGDATKFTHLTEISTPGIYSYTLSADDIDAIEAANATSVGVYRKTGTEGQNPCVYSIEVFGCRDLIFDDHNGTHVWNDPLNWAPNYVEIPSYSQATRILKPCIVNIADAQAMNVKLCKGIGNNGSLTINADAALSVRDEISEVHNKDFSTLYPVAASDLVILSNASNQGALAHGDVGSNTHATVQFYARGNGTGPRGENLGTATWQYMGVPFSDVTNAQSHYYGAWMCQWIEDTKGNAGSNWKWVGNNDALTPFAGYCLTQNGSMTYTNAGTLVSSANHVLSLTYAGTDYKGWNMFANSWMAPINIAQFEDADFTGDVDKSIYLFNTGISDGETEATAGSASSDAGNYVAVPINSAGSMLESNRTIAPMQGFYLLATGETSASVTLDYNKLVRKSDHSALSVLPNRAPAKIQSDEEDSEMPRIIIDVKGEHFSDRLYIFENPDQTNGFDNGWDGWKFEGETYAPQLMTRTGELDLAVDVSPAFDGKRIAFRVGEDSEYTLLFSSTEDGLYLRDLTTNDTVAIAAGNTYSFMAFNSVSEERFEIIDRRNEIPSGWEEIKDDASFDILDMTVYTADGRLVLHRTTDFNKPLALPQNGTYIVYLTTTAGKHVHKIVF